MATTYHKRAAPPMHASSCLSVRTRKDDLVEKLHGVAVADPYRWLEDGESPEVRAWDEAQNGGDARVAGRRPRARRRCARA